tara:strand:- start:62827 stop:64116 length:1290 start_codon:yes stop_codon:yes gene_type:complete
MSDLNDVVQVVIYDQSTAIATTSFSIPLILSTFTDFSERTRTYTGITGVGEDFSSTSPVYKMAEKLFGQAGVLGAIPPSIVVGRRQVDEVTITPTVANNQTYTVTLNGVDYNYTSDADATAAEIATGLVTAIGVVSGITVTDNTGSLTVEVTTPGDAWSITVSSNLVKVDTTPTETWVEALEAVEQENDSWYCLVSDVQTTADQEALSDAIQAREKIYGLSSADAVAPTTGTTDIGYLLNAKSAARTFGVYSPTAATEYPEAAWVGSQLAVTPGSNDWDFKRANGVTVSKLSSTAITNLKAKSWNYYIAKAGVNIFQNGDMFDGKPIDTAVGKDWLKARLQEAVYFRMINVLKIPLTDPGLLIIENEIRSVMAQAESNGLVDTGWTVSTPPVSSIPENLRAQRTAGVFVIRARLAGAVRKVDIEVYLSV